MPHLDPAPFRARRERLLAQMHARGGGVALLATAPEQMRNRDSDHPYRHDSHFFYLTGFTEPEALLVLAAHADGTHRSVLFCRAKDETREIWDGYRFGPDAARDTFGFDAAFAIGEVDAHLPDLLADQPALFVPLARPTALDGPLARALAALQGKARSGVRTPATRHDLLPLLDEMRVVKDAAEIDTMRRACRIAADAHARAMRACRPGLREYHLEAELLHAFRSAGAQAPAYNAIVAAGANACVLHYRAGDAELRDGELCLIDAGCELDSYAADVTRTFPVNGRFSGPQRAVYELVLAAQHAALDATRPGAAFSAPHDAAVRVLTQGLIDLKLVDGSVDGALESGAFRQFYMHKTSHWLGLDVHDVGDYLDPATAATGSGRPPRTLQPGMVLTIEPGLYLRPAANVPEAFHHIGVRIEDDVLLTAGGCEILSAAAPKHADEIEALMRS
ncbi:MAG: Xaa-Pro aminopeptidase [Burkholderiaceae bacterium]|nr:Xaa-Pro aminopeptidase [Burkholderiaceae bacterium]